MEVIELNINGEVVVPEVVEVVGEVRANPIDAGVTNIVINGETQPIDNGTVSFSIPTKTSDIDNDSGFIDKDVDDLTNYTKSSEFAAVATSGDYNDLENKPVIPVVPTNVSAFTNDAGYITKDVDNLTNYTKSSELATVATTGNYNDLSNKPQIPTKTIVEVNAIQTTGIRIAQITVDGQSTDLYADQGGSGTNVHVTETLSSGTKVANILVDGQDNDVYVPTIPSNVSSFNNDAGYITNSDLSGLASTNYVDTELAKKQDKIDSSNKLPASSVSGLSTVATTGSYDDLTNKPTIPSISGLASETYVTNAVSDHNSSSVSHTDIRNDISAINGKIPSAATSQNQLADKAFVNSTINSLAAFFRGTFATQLDLLAVQWQTSDPDAANYVSNNDYAYVQEVVAGQAIGTWDPADHIGEAWRFIYVIGEGWQPQFMVNETPFTQAQLDAINSGITSGLVTQIGTNTTAIAGKQDIIDASHKLPASNISGLSTVATSGAYSDLSGKPDLSIYAQSANLATVATSGSYSDLSNKPSIPDATSVTQVQSTGTKIATITVGSTSTDIYAPSQTAQVQANWNETDQSAASYIQNKPTIPTQTSQLTNNSGYITKSVNNLDNYTPTSSLAAVATSGNYSDLSGTPTIPAAQIQSDWNQTNTSSKDYIKNKPTIPVVPTNVSAFTNDAGYITTAAMPVVSVSSGSVAMDANKYYDFGTLTANTTVTLNAGQAGKVNEYCGKFTAASTYTFTFPSGVVWSDTLIIVPGNTYEFSIVNNKGIFVEFSA